MENLVPLGTGNSRLMKSNIPASTTLAQLIQMLNNGTFPYDIGPLNPAGISQQGTPLNKATLFSDQTMAKYPSGIEDPDGALAYVGKYVQHWWRRKNLTVDYTIDVKRNELDGVFGGREHSTKTCRYGDSLIYRVDGSIGLVNEKSFSFTTASSLEGLYTLLRGKFFISYNSAAAPKLPNGTILYGYEDIALSFYSTTSGEYQRAVKNVSKVTVNNEVGDWEYVQSSDRSAYPDSGEQDGYEYEYLGIPFENAVVAPKIETGSYVGTGTFGSSNPNTLTFPFVPKLVIIQTTTENAGFWSNLIMFYGSSRTRVLSYDSAPDVYVSFSGEAVSWYSSSDIGQFNFTGYNFNYIAIG